PVDDSAAPIKTADGRVAGVVLVFRDVTERRRAERERASLFENERQARTEAERANRSKDQFLAVVSHELRTPLNAILGWADMLRRGRLDETRRDRAFQSIYDSARRQAQLIDDLLDVSRIMAGTLRIEWTAVDLKTVVDDAVRAVQPAGDAKNV